MSFKLYKSTDANAPVLSGTQGSVINVLRKCLIEGYGDKTPPVGWEMPFINGQNNLAVFRNTQGTGSFLRVNESTGANNIATVLAYETMADIDNGTLPFHSTAISFNKSSTVDTVARKWFLIASDKTFHLVSFINCLSAGSPPSTNNGYYMLSFGNYLEFNPHTLPAFLVVSSCEYYTYGFFSLGASSFQIRTPRNYLGAPSTQTTLYCQLFGYLNGASTNDMAGIPRMSKTMMCEIGLYDSTGVNAHRGAVPGIYLIPHRFTDFTFGEIITEGGLNYIVFPVSPYTNSAFYFKIFAFEFTE